MQKQTTLVTQESAANKGKKWFIVDATDKPLGRLASEVAVVLMGKNKVDYTPSVDCGDYVIVINAAKVRQTGDKLHTRKYFDNKRGSYMGLRTRTAKEMVEQFPVELVTRAIKGMIPHSSLGRKIALKLFVYADDKYEQTAQTPVKVELTAKYKEK